MFLNFSFLGKTYFFKDDMFYQFYDNKMRVKKGYPKSIRDHFWGCSERRASGRTSGRGGQLSVAAFEAKPHQTDKNADNGCNSVNNVFQQVLMSLICMFLYMFVRS